MPVSENIRNDMEWFKNCSTSAMGRTSERRVGKIFARRVLAISVSNASSGIMENGTKHLNCPPAVRMDIDIIIARNWCNPYPTTCHSRNVNLLRLCSVHNAH